MKRLFSKEDLIMIRYEEGGSGDYIIVYNTRGEEIEVFFTELHTFDDIVYRYNRRLYHQTNDAENIAKFKDI